MEKFGRVNIEPKDAIIASSMCSWTLTYVVGKYGIDDGGSLIVVRKNLCDRETPQFDNSLASGYISASTSGNAKLRLSFDNRYFYRPWSGALVIYVYDGFLKEGDSVTIIFGDQSRGGPGTRAQTFQEKEHIFKFLVDPFRSRVYYEVASPPCQIIGGPADCLQLVAPSECVVNTPFSLLVRVLDRWGNPSQFYTNTIMFEDAAMIKGLPTTYLFEAQDQGVKRFKGIRVLDSGIYRIRVKDADGTTSISNPIRVHKKDQETKLFWGDIHGQTHGVSRGIFADTVGAGTPREYFAFARDVAAIDFCSWQGNDFQVSNDLWNDVCQETKRFNQPGTFVTFVGYEWSGNTSCGGDHNILYLSDDQKIYRSSHALIEDKSDIDDDKCPITELWQAFHGRKDIMAIPHVGGRYANFDFYDHEFIHLVEIHSFHGTFEWFAKEALDRGFKVGFIAGGDDHTCRPGLSPPLNKMDKTKGGLVAVYANELTRSSLWQSLLNRHCYGTTGARIILSVEMDEHIMGDEFRTNSSPKIHVKVHGTTHLHEVSVFRGLKQIYRYSLVKKCKSDTEKIKIMWSGARSKGRNKRTDWSGSLSLNKGQIISFTPFAFQNFDSIRQVTPQTLRWNSGTIGNYKGLIMTLEASDDAKISFNSKPKTFSFTPLDLKTGAIVIDAGGVDQRIEVRNISDQERPKDVEFEYIDDEIKYGLNAYWVRVQQCDGEMAWSSPIFAHYNLRA
jgi:hypothetical protein